MLRHQRLSVVITAFDSFFSVNKKKDLRTSRSIVVQVQVQVQVQFFLLFVFQQWSNSELGPLIIALARIFNSTVYNILVSVL